MTGQTLYQAECKTITDFQAVYNFAWDRFRRLGALDPELSRLNRFRWRTAVETAADTGPKLRRWTHKVAALIRENPMGVLEAMKVSPKLADPRPKSALIDTYQRLTLSGSSPEELCKLAIELAGDRGLAGTAGTLLREAFQKEAHAHLESAMILLPTLIYIGYRYQKPREFKWTVDQVLLAMDKRKPGTPCSPVIHSLCLSQLACAFSERMDSTRASDAFHDPGVRALIDSDTEIPWFRPQLLRGRAAFHVLRSSHPRAAQEDLKRCEQWKNEGNFRAIATLRHSMLARASPPKFGDAWTQIQPFHDSGVAALLSAMQAGRNQIRDMAHLFPSVYFGALMRHLAGASGNRDDLAQDKMVLDWCYTRYGVMLLDDPGVLPPKYVLPKELAEIRECCMRKPFTADELETLDKLAAAIREVPH